MRVSKKVVLLQPLIALASWSGSSAWLECLPVTQEVASSSLVRTAKSASHRRPALFCFMKKRNGPCQLIMLCLSGVMLLWLLVYVSLIQHEWQLHERERLAEEAWLADSVVTLLFAGDVMGHEPQWKAAYDPLTGEYDYHDCFRFVQPIVEQADLACANLEVTLAGPPYTSYPCFSSPDALLFALKDAGFDVLFTANNHVLDHGSQGLERTICMLDSVDIAHAGSYVDSLSRAAEYPLLVEVKGLRIAFLNMTYGTNGIRVPKPNMVNKLNRQEVASDLERLDSLEAKLMVAFVHWGNEYQLEANKYQRSFAEFLVDQGIDLIIGGHPHVSQDADTLFNREGKPVVSYYSLGNFISNQRRHNTNGGIMVQVSVNRFTGRVIETGYIPYYVFKGLIDGKYQYYVIPTIPYINNRCNFRLPAYDSMALVRVHNAMVDRLSDFIPIFADSFEIEEK